MTKVYKFSKNSRQKMSLSQQLRREREAKKLTGFNNLNTRVPIYEGAILKGYLDQEPSVAKFVKAYEKAIKKPKGQKIKRSKVMGNGCFAILMIFYLLGVSTTLWLTKTSYNVSGEVTRAYAKEVELVKIEEVEVVEVKEPTIEDKVKEYFGADSDWAITCMQSENSTQNPRAENWNVGGSVDIGLMMVNAYWHCNKLGYAPMDNTCIEELKNVDTNLRVAKQILDDSGKGAWYGITCN